MATQTYINDAMVKRFASAAKRLEEKTRPRCPEELPAEIDEAMVEQQNLEEDQSSSRSPDQTRSRRAGRSPSANSGAMDREGKYAGTRLRWRTRWTD